jgi:hypothetical protein
MVDLKAKIFADGADRDGMLEMYRNPLVAGGRQTWSWCCRSAGGAASPR